MTTMNREPNIIDRVAVDHRQVEQMLDRFDTVGPDHRADLFCELTETLVRHEVAEEQVIYPTIRRVTASAEEVADARIHEESEAEELLASMEKQDPASDEFVASFAKLKGAVLEHAQREEAEVFPLIRQNEPDDVQRSMGERFEKVKRAAPTHPHPHVPTPLRAIW